MHDPYMEGGIKEEAKTATEAASIDVAVHDGGTKDEETSDGDECVVVSWVEAEQPAKRQRLGRPAPWLAASSGSAPCAIGARAPPDMSTPPPKRVCLSAIAKAAAEKAVALEEEASQATVRAKQATEDAVRAQAALDEAQAKAAQEAREEKAKQACKTLLVAPIRGATSIANMDAIIIIISSSISISSSSISSSISISISASVPDNF